LGTRLRLGCCMLPCSRIRSLSLHVQDGLGIGELMDAMDLTLDLDDLVDPATQHN
jgi:hypothetical protein